MAITPLEAAQIRDEELAQADALEKEYDAQIREQYAAGRKVYVGLSGKVSERVRKEVMRRYAAAGWIVEYHCDQRDGASLTFTPSSPAPGGYRE